MNNCLYNTRSEQEYLNPNYSTLVMYLVCLWWLCLYSLSVVSSLSRESYGFVSISTVQSIVCANNEVHYVLKVVLVCLRITLFHYSQYVDLSEGTENIKCLSCIFCQVCVEDWVSPLNYHYTIYGAVCVSAYPFLLRYLWECLYFIWSSSSNRNYESLAIVYG